MHGNGACARAPVRTHNSSVPANLTPQYHDAEERFKAASTHDERLAAMREMIALLPKHKGTEKLFADLKKRLAKLETEVEHAAHGGRHADPGHVKREGAGQWVLLGEPNAGKSSLLAALTHAHPEIGEYPFTTRAPLPGMMPFEDVQVQLVDTPAVAAGHTPALPREPRAQRRRRPPRPRRDGRRRRGGRQAAARPPRTRARLAAPAARPGRRPSVPRRASRDRPRQQVRPGRRDVRRDRARGDREGPAVSPGLGPHGRGARRAAGPSLPGAAAGEGLRQGARQEARPRGPVRPARRARRSTTWRNGSTRTSRRPSASRGSGGTRSSTGSRSTGTTSSPTATSSSSTRDAAARRRAPLRLRPPRSPSRRRRGRLARAPSFRGDPAPERAAPHARGDADSGRAVPVRALGDAGRPARRGRLDGRLGSDPAAARRPRRPAPLVRSRGALLAGAGPVARGGPRLRLRSQPERGPRLPDRGGPARGGREDPGGGPRGREPQRASVGPGGLTRRPLPLGGPHPRRRRREDRPRDGSRRGARARSAGRRTGRSSLATAGCSRSPSGEGRRSRSSIPPARASWRRSRRRTTRATSSSRPTARFSTWPRRTGTSWPCWTCGRERSSGRSRSRWARTGPGAPRPTRCRTGPRPTPWRCPRTARPSSWRTPTTTPWRSSTWTVPRRRRGPSVSSRWAGTPRRSR